MKPITEGRQIAARASLGYCRPGLWALAAAVGLAVAFGAAGPVRAASESGAYEVPAAAHNLVRRADALLAKGEAADAEPLLLQALDDAPQWLRPHGLLGLARQMQGDEAGAKAEYATMQAGILEGPPAQVKKVAGLCAEVIWLINESRHAAGLPMLRPQPLLSLMSTEHSEEMRDKGYFAHESPDLGSPAQRFAGIFGYRPGAIGENIARRTSSSFTLTLANIRGSHQDLMKSPGHRANILGASYTDVGVGIAASRGGDYWLTEDFVRFVN